MFLARLLGLFLFMTAAVQAGSNEGYVDSIKNFFHTQLGMPSSAKATPMSLAPSLSASSSPAKVSENASAPAPAETTATLLTPAEMNASTQKDQEDVIFPHIATYKITLDKSAGNNEIDDANGIMTIKIWDTGDGWVFEQNSTLFIYSASGEGEQIHTNVATWQDYAGNHYRFNSRTLRNEQEEDVIRGVAHKGAEVAPGAENVGSGKVIYHMPNNMEINIPNETIFPLHHLINAIRHARHGKTVISNTVFDGSAETQEAVAVTTTISQSKEVKIKVDSAIPKGLNLSKVWSMNLGVYPLNSKSADPEYEIKQDVFDQGIINTMTLDYGNFQVVATLDKIEFFT
jgi:hypothetical protein